MRIRGSVFSGAKSDVWRRRRGMSWCDIKSRTILTCAVLVVCALWLGCSQEHSPWTEPEFVQWQLEHPESTDPLAEYIRDGSQPVKSRQRVWQARQKSR